MQKQLINDKRIKLSGTAQQITQAEQVLSSINPPIATMSESEARLKIQTLIDSGNIKAGILFDGNSVWGRKKIIRDIKRVKNKGMNNLTNHLYNFLHLCCGSIAHYNKLGWIETYPTIEHLRQFFRSNEFGQRVLSYIPYWKSDVHNIVEEIEEVLGI